MTFEQDILTLGSGLIGSGVLFAYIKYRLDKQDQCLMRIESSDSTRDSKQDDRMDRMDERMNVHFDKGGGE